MNALIDKNKKIPVVQSNRIEKIVDLGLDVPNLTNTIEALESFTTAILVC